MEKQYPAYYLPQEYIKKKLSINIYNLGTTLLKTQSTICRVQKSQDNEVFVNFPVFLPEHMFLATKLAWQNNPDICFMKQNLIRKIVAISFLSAIHEKNFIAEFGPSHGVRAKNTLYLYGFKVIYQGGQS